jgi:hypothetical protein
MMPAQSQAFLHVHGDEWEILPTLADWILMESLSSHVEHYILLGLYDAALRLAESTRAALRRLGKKLFGVA